MPWTTAQRATQYAYYRRRALDLLRQLEESYPQSTDLEHIIQVATCLRRASPFITLNHFFQTIHYPGNHRLESDHRGAT